MSVSEKAYSRGASQDHKTTTFIPADQNIRCGLMRKAAGVFLALATVCWIMWKVLS